MQLEWVNHASFIAEAAGVRLISDPWLDGTVFADGWGLLSPSVLTPKDFDGITHLWFSHEHADHFAPANLRRIPPQVREQLTVLYQRTRDRKVVKWLRANGFTNVQELTPGAWVELAPGFRVMNQLARYNDSWLAVETEEALLLNLNDCILDTEAYMHEVMAQLPRPVDVLMVQYSYSARVANRGEHERFREEAERVLRTITMMTRVARPRYVIPFASFVWFCHEENAYMNAGATPVAVAAEHLGATTGAEPVVMYPGDRWQVGDAHDSRRAVERYERDLHAMLGGERQLVQAPIHDFDELVAAGHEFRRRLLSADGLALMARVMLGSVPATSIYLEDLGQAANYSLSRGLRRTTTGRGRCDVALTSDALSYMFRHMWGGETLRINGRFQVPPDGHYANFDRYITLGNLANHGRSYAWHLLTHTPVYRSSPVRHLREWTSRCQRLIPRMPGKSGSPRSAGRRPRGLDRRRLMPARPRARAGGRRGGR